MDALTLLITLVVGVIVLTPAAEKIKIPQPVLLTIFGLVVALVLPVGELDLDPGLILPIVLPPLLFAATQRTTVNEFREHAGPVLFLAVGLTLATVAVVAVVAHAGGLPWTVAWVLGAMVSPPDPVAATAVARRLKLPHRLVTILEGEGMFNDATALVAYKVAIAAAVTGDFSAGGVGLELLEAIVLGVGVGLVVARVTTFVLARVHDAYAETTLTVLVPFAAYVAAEHVNGSGVLAVLVLGLYLRTFGHGATTSQGWLLGRAVWSYADFLITSLVFALLGFELITVIRTVTVDRGTVILSLAVVLALVLFRAAWILPSAGLAGARARRRDVPLPTNWRESLVVSWAGMRGVVTVATALALPEVVDSGAPLPSKDELVFVALVCVLLTLVIQGVTLTPLTRALGVGSEADSQEEVATLRRRAAEAALEHIRSEGDPEQDPEEGSGDDPRGSGPVLRAAEQQYLGYLASQDALEEQVSRQGGDADDTQAEDLRGLLRRAGDAERQLVLRARRTGEVSAGSADEVLRDIEARAMRDFS